MRTLSLLLAAVSVWAAGPLVGPQSGMPYLTADARGAVLLSWIDPLPDGGHALRFARWKNNAWSPAETIASGKNWFVNWADFPSIAAMPDGALYAHWLVRPAEAGKYGYGIKVARRAPNGQWREVHGGGHHRKTVRYISFQNTGAVAADAEIDADACSCCQTAIARTANGLIAAYRDHLPGEIRDISVIRLRNGAWSKPEPVHNDGWKINGCPTEGPSIASHGRDVAIAWLTRANAQPRIHVALSHNAGDSFAAPARLDDGNPLGRPAIIANPAGGYLVVWLEKKSESRVEVRLRKITATGTKHPSVIVAEAPAGRASGLPKIAISGNHLLVAWRDERVRTAVLSLQSLAPSSDE